MAEGVYAVSDLRKKVRYGRRETEREERIVDIYVSADDLDPGPSTQQDAAQQNTAQAQNGGSEESKNHRASAAAVCLGLLGLLCVILVAVIIGLVKNNSHLKNNLIKELAYTQSRLTEQNADLLRYINLTEKNADIQSKYINLTEQKVQIQSSYDQLQSRYNNVTAERDYLKRRLYESYGFKCAGGLCYYISTEHKNWEESRQYCIDRHSDLIIINSKEKQDLTNTLNHNVWLGLTDRVTEGEWKWVDGTPLTPTPTHWRPGEPNNHGEEDCAVFYKGSSESDTGWNDMKCSVKDRWICERMIK